MNWLKIIKILAYQNFGQQKRNCETKLYRKLMDLWEAKKGKKRT